jgi:hypothetical protein
MSDQVCDQKKYFFIFLLIILSISCNSLAGNIPTSSPKPTEQPSEAIVYYSFVTIRENAPPEGSVVILPNDLILAPTMTNKAPGPDNAANIHFALEAVINDPHNPWTSKNLAITHVAFGAGHALVDLQGEIFGAGDILLIAARMQILMTVFADASVQTATVTFNGESIANLGISNSREARPADYVYNRSEIETFMAENAYLRP